MKIKPEQIPAELKHRSQILQIDIELFINSNDDKLGDVAQHVLPRLKELNKEFIKIKDSEDLSSEVLKSAKKILTEIIDYMHDIKVEDSLSKNEKIALINQLHEINDILSVKI
ncbi:MAG: hypothetical protein U9N85_02610 [Bacteroidota bacterium]|nr:hypothetical protein [Bacteroidota bacterium]